MHTAKFQKRLKTIAEAATELNVGRSTVYQLINQKQLEIIKIGRCTRIPDDAIARYIEQLRSGHEPIISR